MMVKKIVDCPNAYEACEGLIHLLYQVKRLCRIKRVTTNLFKLKCFQQSDSIAFFRNSSNSRKGTLCGASNFIFKSFGVIPAG